jgi:DNA-binding NarL/FixJ family response regulator
VHDVRVLIVDDHEPFRCALSEMVNETAGFRTVACVATAERFLSLIADTPADLVLMDINLPGIDGLEATRRLTSGPKHPVVVLLSTFEEGELDFREYGATNYCSKATFGPDRLVQIWSEVGRP